MVPHDLFTPSASVLLRPWYRAFRELQHGVSLPYYRFLDRYRLNDLNEIYSEEYFEKRANPPYDNGTKVAVDVLDEHFDPNSVFDVGCAIGVYLKYFSKKGVDVAGIEGAESAVERALVDTIQHYDLRDSPKISNQKFDLVLCIEVAEHLHTIYADGFIDTIISATHNDSTVVFTAAPPGQYGANHINLQHPRYWVKKFSERGWEHQEKLSALIAAEIRERSDTPLVMTENLMTFQQKD